MLLEPGCCCIQLSKRLYILRANLLSYYLAMTFEERRRKLKLTGPRWGDLPEQLPHHVNSVARELRLADFDSKCASTSDAMTRNDMKGAAESTPSPSGLAISTVGWSLTTLLESSQGFRLVPRIPCNEKDLKTSIDDYQRSGVPCIIEGWHNHEKWPKDLFTIDSFSQNVKGE
jgi:hypothetical protein